ncbi:MAG TPA: zf-HC2 domain-containing protein [Chloroflexota bacterium]|nr:zf-HC2 domain-containing protein [Chloroflexota bacterium]
MNSQDHVADALSEYLNGDLPEARRALIQEHLAECVECRQDLASLRFTVRVLGQLPDHPAPRSFALSERQSAPRPFALPTNLFWLRTAMGAVAALLVVVLALRFASPSRQAAGPNGEFASAPTSAPVAAVARSQPQVASGGAAPQNSVASTAAQPASGSAPADGQSAAPAAQPTAAAAPAATSAPAAAAQSVASVATPPAPTVYPPGTTPNPAAAQPVAPVAATAYPYPAPSSAGGPTDASAPPNATAEVARAAPAAAPRASDQSPARNANAQPEPLLQPGPGPAWYSPALGLLVVLAVVSAGVLFLLDRRRR